MYGGMGVGSFESLTHRSGDDIRLRSTKLDGSPHFETISIWM
jgi:hypothetical protein